MLSCVPHVIGSRIRSYFALLCWLRGQGGVTGSDLACRGLGWQRDRQRWLVAGGLHQTPWGWIQAVAERRCEQVLALKV